MANESNALESHLIEIGRLATEKELAWRDYKKHTASWLSANAMVAAEYKTYIEIGERFKAAVDDFLDGRWSEAAMDFDKEFGNGR